MGSGVSMEGLMSNVLNQSVLVLNRYWTAVHVTNASRALVLLYGDRARVVTDDYSTYDFHSWRELSEVMDQGQMIRTPSCRIAVPEVIILNNFHRIPPRQIKFSRRNIYLRDHHTCQYCGRLPAKDELTIDHVVPRSRGGKTTWENVVLACMKCNTRKGNKLLADSGMKLLSEPRKPKGLIGSCFYQTAPVSSFWQKFLDNAYWNAALEE